MALALSISGMAQNIAGFFVRQEAAYEQATFLHKRGPLKLSSLRGGC